ncbi:aminotransferase class III-fold pyridoxal phosphate-dependent enzyme [Paracoccus litorisediminis]|uniref:Aminotransferase class III-fold pyridoxal phosphate-dependent enzyme n=1 Tax=Paracoccus litorisediminis TaxID=2006130 RepID=A0A844HVI4_9RHOB|nr:aminotransferase class III-fold pyridoxal phosphate-dependent enzyme [Paracoccus litorisediminis]MTH62484.1 aminotransferase class III-fold pyridoxal phosphate-dependent enzyme [Paracoccus litorisediminis]
MKDFRQRELVERARLVIPNGMYGHESVASLPAGFPQFFSRADGASIWDADGNKFVDLMCAYGPNLLGYGNAGVEWAAERQRALGDTSTGPSEIMVKLAEDFVAMIDHADWAMFCKNGTDATSMAMVTARAYRGRRKILLARGAYHGAAPWNTPGLAGIVAEDRAHVIYFDYNDLNSLADAIRGHEGDIAGIFATPFRHEAFANQTEPSLEYAQGVRRVCDELDALLVVDEVRAGFRLSRDCTWSLLGVRPDLSCWGKVLGNGYPISALLGAEKARIAAGSIYATGSFWFSAVPMAAAVETLRQVRETDYLERLTDMALRFRAGVAVQAATYGFGVMQTGPAQMTQILFEDDADLRRGFHWVREALEGGLYLHPWHNMFFCSAMTEADLEVSLTATDRAFAALKAVGGKLPAQDNAAILTRIARMAKSAA